MSKKNGKKITTDHLARIINKGFDGQMDYLKEQFGHINKRFDQVDKQFERVDKRLEKVEENVGEVKKVLTDARVL